jgi:hypothetical protein
MVCRPTPGGSWRAAAVGCACAQLAALLGGCAQPRAPAIGPGAIIQLQARERTVSAEVAFEYNARKYGLMDRKHLAEDSGMLFVYPSAEYLGFWMRNTLIPLSIAFISDDGEILQIEDMKPKDERTVRSKHKVRFALEMNQGWFTRAQMAVGDRFPEFREKLEPFVARAESDSPRRGVGR